LNSGAGLRFLLYRGKGKAPEICRGSPRSSCGQYKHRVKAGCQMAPGWSTSWGTGHSDRTEYFGVEKSHRLKGYLEAVLVLFKQTQNASNLAAS
jgi:hypothetical protein